MLLRLLSLDCQMLDRADVSVVEAGLQWVADGLVIK